MAQVSDLSDLLPGDPEVIAAYRIQGRLGSGGQGVVYLATGPSGERVAIKQLRFGRDDDRALQQFVKEATAARLVAPFCTARVLDVKLDGHSPYVVSEYIDGPSLQQRIERQGPMTDASLQRLAIGTITALAAIHQAGVVHRDFKPANVMLASDGPRVIDFGIARDLSTETTVTSKVFGTPAYMAPEQLRAERIGPATDVFAWASVIAFAATGRAPFEALHMAATMHRIAAETPDLTGVPPELTPVLLRCLAKDPSARPTAQQVLALLLGRTVPVQDSSDPTRVLAEATEIAHEDAPVPAPSRPIPGTAPLTVQGGETLTAPGGPSRRPGRVTVLITLGVLLWVGAAGAGVWGYQNGLFASDDSAAGGKTPPATSAAPGSPTRTASNRPTTAGPSSAPSSAPTSAADQPKGTIPAGFAGDWQGTARQPPGSANAFIVQIELTAGSKVGKLTLPALNCSGPLTLTEVSDTGLVFESVLSDDPAGACITRGTVRLDENGPDQLVYNWTNATAEADTSTAILVRG